MIFILRDSYETAFAPSVQKDSALAMSYPLKNLMDT